MHPEVLQRTRQLLQRLELGLPLVDRLAQAAARPARVPALSVAALIASTALTGHHGSATSWIVSGPNANKVLRDRSSRRAMKPG